MCEYYVNLLLACIVVLLIFFAIYAWNNTKLKPYIERFILNVIKPFIKKKIIEIITQVELNYEDIKSAGSRKMTEVIINVTMKLPPPIRNFISAEEVEKLCQSVFDKIKDVLPELVEKLKNDK